MSFSIFVHRRQDDAFFSDNSFWQSNPSREEIGARIEQGRRLTLFEYPLAAYGIFYQYWAGPAEAIGLPLLSRVAEHGLNASGESLKSLKAEADALEQHWGTLDLEARAPLRAVEFIRPGERRTTRVPLRDHLAERMAAMKKAIEIATAEDGVLVIV